MYLRKRVLNYNRRHIGSTLFSIVYKRKKVLMALVFLFVLIYVWLWIKRRPKLCFHNYKIEFHVDEDSNLLKNNTKCKIPDIDPFNWDAIRLYKPNKFAPCTETGLLTYVIVRNNTAVLKINKTESSKYHFDMSCCYRMVRRSAETSDSRDDEILFMPLYCIAMSRPVILSKEFEAVYVRCYNAYFGVLYENVHSIVRVKEEVVEKVKKLDSSVQPFNVLLIGIDSVSRINLERTMPDTLQFLEDHGFISLNGYNKVGENTLPNIMPIMTGLNYTRGMNICDPLNDYYKCPFIWDIYSDLGYTTAYSEDDCEYSTFNFRTRGFKEAPVDYYFRPYMLACEQLSTRMDDLSKSCLGPIHSAERVMNNAKDFLYTLKNYPFFALFWMNTFSHNFLMTPTTMDEKVNTFLENIHNYGIFNNTIVFFMSDHGLRFGEIRMTVTGWLEERLPYMYISVPERFKHDFPEAYSNLKSASHKLTSPFDLYMTLQHILMFSGTYHEPQLSESCPECKSFFSDIKEDRSCEEAGIPQHYCACSGYKAINVTEKLVQDAVNYVIDHINDIIKTENLSRICAHFKIKQIVSASVVSKRSSSGYMKNYILLTVMTRPRAVFEATLEYSVEVNGKRSFEISDRITRLDRYGDTSYCLTNHPTLPAYCYCNRLLFIFPD